MLEEIMNDPEIEKYLVTFQEGDILCHEGDESQDLFFLVSGRVEVLKGKKKISEISEKGSSLGEMSFLLGTRRTATIKAKRDGKAIRIPKEKIEQFLKECPSLAWQIPRDLAERLRERTQAFYALTELSDQLPDAVIATDREGNIISWNKAAERLFGRTWEEMKHGSVQEIYEEPELYRKFLKEVQSKYSVRERVLKVKHPNKGTRYISTSTSVLYDGHHNLQGVLSVNRDVTDMQHLQRKYKRARLWLIPSLVFLGLVAGGLFYAYPRLSEKEFVTGLQQETLRDQLARDHLLIKSLLGEAFSERDAEKLNTSMEEFFAIQEKSQVPYTGLLLLDHGKRVFGAYSLKTKEKGMGMLGSSYAGITFEDIEGSLHKVLTLYRADTESPMGRKGVEIAFEMRDGSDLLGWVVFQMDMDRLKNRYGAGVETLRRLRFQRP
jgi:PAS domain S-box-containing protein